MDQNQNPLIEETASNQKDEKSLKSDENFSDYIQSLNVWIWQCQTWMYFHGACQQAQIQQQQQQQSSFGDRINNGTGNGISTNNGTGVLLRIPTIRKRILASIIDYFLIHFLYDQFRMLVTEIWDYEVPFTTIDFKELESLFPKDDDGLEDLIPKVFWIYTKTIQYATIFYLFYLIYETMFLWGWPNNSYPGSTIGKRILGLRVVSCDRIEEISISDNLVRVSPAGNITFVKAFFRTLVKLLPISNTAQCFNILSSRYNRSYFDSFMGCMVVDITPSGLAAAVAAAAAVAPGANNIQRRPAPLLDNNNNNQNQNNLNVNRIAGWW